MIFCLSIFIRDGVRISECSGITVYNCRIGAGHDGVCIFSVLKTAGMYNCDIEVHTNTGVRIDNCANIEVDHNTFSVVHGSGWCCAEMENSLTNANIHHNIFMISKDQAAVQALETVHATGSISVHDNVMWNVGIIHLETRVITL